MTAISEIAKSGFFAYGAQDGKMAVIEAKNLINQTPAVTVCRLLKHKNLRRGLPFGRIFNSNHSNSYWEDNYSIRCFVCRQLFVPSQTILDNLDLHIQNLPSLKLRLPCLELPASAWENEKLNIECPHCRHPLRLNPFLVDNKNLNYKVTFSLKDY